MGKEIEIKYLIDKIPDNVLEVLNIEQYYTKISGLEEIRYRSVNNNEFFRTVKRGHGILREEYEVKINKEDYEENKNKIVGKYISKQRSLVEYSIDSKTYVIEVDKYKGELEGLLVAEVEFESIEESNKFVENKPDWFVEDVTEQKEYKNKNLATRG